MPTNVTRPVWACDTCGNTFGERLDLAELCESAPIPDALPAGTPLLARDNDGLVLRPLTVTDKVSTKVREYQPVPGHIRHYAFTTSSGQVSHVESDSLWPHQPGHLQMGMARNFTLFHRQASKADIDVRAVARHIGLGQPGSFLLGATGRHPGKLEWWGRNLKVMRPITAEVRAVLDRFGARLSFGGHDDSKVRMALLEAAGSWRAANWAAETINLGALVADHQDRQRAWFDGAPVERHVIKPYLTTRSDKTASKLTKADKQVVEACGVEWQPRTTATEYINRVVRELLEEEIVMPEGLFAGPRIIAVGGVKGGVGKSFTAAALASRLAAEGQRVVLLDADLNGPSQHLLWNLGPMRVSADNLRIVPEPVAANLSVLSVGQLAGSKELPDRWSQGTSMEFMQFLGATVDLSGIDLLVVDLPAGSETAAEVFLAHGRTEAMCDVHVAVTTADPLAMSDTEGGLRPQMHERWTPIVVENLAYATGRTKDGDTVTVRVRGDGTEVPALADRFRADFAGSLPWAPSVAALAASVEVGLLAGKVVAAVAARPPRDGL